MTSKRSTLTPKNPSLMALADTPVPPAASRVSRWAESSLFCSHCEQMFSIITNRHPRGCQTAGRVMRMAKQAVKRVESLVKGLAVICAFNRDRPRMTLSEAAKIVSLPRATARRLLHTLVDLGYVETDGKLFQLAPRLLEVGYSYLGSLPWWEIALPHMQRVSEKLDETCVASVLAGEEIVMIARRRGTRLTAINVPMGSRLPAHATAM